MTQPVTLFTVIILVAFLCGHVTPADENRKDKSEKGRNTLHKNRERRQRSISSRDSPAPAMLKVLDFSADNDQKQDSDGELTSATFDAGATPESFTICSAFMIEAWTTDFSASFFFAVVTTQNDIWGYIYLNAAPGYTEYEVSLEPVYFVTRSEDIFFPLQWTRVCLSSDSLAKKVSLIVDGKQVGEGTGTGNFRQIQPDNLILLLGLSPHLKEEYTGRVTELNIFNSSLSLEKMKNITTAGGEECGTPGDLISWHEAEWTLHSQAKVIEMDREWEGP